MCVCMYMPVFLFFLAFSTIIATGETPWGRGDKYCSGLRVGEGIRRQGVGGMGQGAELRIYEFVVIPRDGEGSLDHSKF